MKNRIIHDERMTRLPVPPQFILISVITAADAIDHLAKHKTPDDSTSILVLSAVSIVVLTAMGVYKIYLNKCAPLRDISAPCRFEHHAMHVVCDAHQSRAARHLTRWPWPVVLPAL